MDAMLIAVVRDWARRGVTPPRDIVLAFFADEEAGGRLGSHWVVDHHPEFFEGATEAVSEVGGFSADIAGTRAYLVQTAEKGIAWMDLLARGTAGHGSAINEDNAVAHLVEALHAIGTHVWPQRLTPTMKALVDGVADLVGITPDYEDLEPIMAALGPVRRFVGASAATSCNLTAVSGGDKVNVVPGRARAMVDIRPLPGDGEAVWATARELAGPHVEVGVINDDVAVESPHDAPLVGAMRAALGRADPDATVLPYLLSAGTDAKALSKLGIAGYGFVPLKLPAGFDFTAMFHGADERVPLDSLDFGVGVLADFLANC
jgi:acetylornithine deacetylase/succinyl-diaminopimelate desuccinylase-like protein